MLLETAVVFSGGLVGGVIGILLPKISSGLSLGVLFAEIIFLIKNTISSEKYLETVILVVTISLGILGAQKMEKLVNGLKVSLGAALFFVIAGDELLQLFGIANSFWNILSSYLMLVDIAQMDVPVSSWEINTSLAVWLIISAIIFFAKGYFTSETFQLNLFPSSYSRVPFDETSTSKSRSSAPQRTFSYPDTLEFNYFDPDNLPKHVQGYADYIFSSVQSLSAEIGFQVDNSRNQAEHLLMLLTNECKRGEHVNPSVPPTRLHEKLFSNYIKWCQSVGTVPNFTPIESGRAYLAKIEDMLVFLLVWGESANLKHMPECLCYLYHKTMHDHLSLAAKKHYAANNVNFYPGYFLDMVVTPIYDVVAASMKAKGDHCNRKTYDDFNEFFWSPACLQYAHHHALTDDFLPDSNNDQMTISDALQGATKTYVEKRSWLHPLYSFHRIFEWHVITFSLLATIAFHNSLVWKTSFTLLVGSFIFWEINFLGIIWTCLEIWTLFPTTSLSGTAIYGYILRLFAGYLVLLYQTVYYHWAWREDTPPEDSIRALGDANFWWWQYLWISLFALCLYFLETLLCWTPKVYSFFMTWNNDLVQVLLNILYPFSQLYVGKAIHTTQSESFIYILFWLTLIAFKLWFGYYYIIFPIAIPSIEIFDDYMNFPEVSFFKAAVLMMIWWFPHFMVYMIDLSIWFSVWCAIVGGFDALFDRQGAVRNTADMRSHFMRLPFAFHQNLMPAEENSHLYARAVSRVSTTGLPTKSTSNDIPSTNPSTHPTRAKSSNELDSYHYSSIPDHEFESVEVSHHSHPTNGTHVAVEEFLDARSKRWVNFGRIWNEIINKLRDGDLLSTVEKDILVFTHFNWLSKPIYLPLYQTAGRVETAIYDYKNAAINYHQKETDPSKKILISQLLKSSFDIPTWEAVTEIWELSRWMLTMLMGPVHNEDLHQVFALLLNWATTDDIYNHFSLNGLPGIVENLSSIVNSLKGAMKNRGKNPVVSTEMLNQYLEKVPDLNQKETSSSTSIKRSISTGFLAAIATSQPTNPSTNTEEDTQSHGRKSDTSKYALLQPFRNNAGLSDRVRDKVRDDMRNILNSVKDSLRKGGTGQESTISPQSQNLIDRITFILSLEKGFLWDDIYASRQIDELAKDIRIPSVLNKMNGLIKLRQIETEPSLPEARRRLHFFVNSLFMSMPSVPSMMYSKDYTCITPFYSEDVLLTRNDLESKNSDGVSTLLYLQTLYKKDWHNFLERLGLVDDQLIWSTKFLQETRMWASMRAQTLFRTVEGMMFTESSIRLLSELEGISETTIEVLSKLKFSYVVAAQAYATMKKTGDHKADDIEFLLSRYPNLRVAYIETLRPTRNEQVSYYSILIKHDPDIHNSDSQNITTSGALSRAVVKNASPYKVKEVYRIKLPGNPILGEGKPENQNHALIFSRGRYLQAIDMNQAGYFEESLKMRNLLQEFDNTGCKILGFREHIFTGSVSSVANYMALQELSFVTLGQRVLTQPLRIRQHYGHPDMFDKIFVMTEGGMSKASRGINLSEDVFAGFNSTIRGHKVEFREFVQVGKGRDVGLQQTYKFEAKLSQGNAEQSISRDMNRICSRLDFFRLLSFYYGGIGHYMANTLVMFTLVLVVYTMVATAIFNEEGVNGRSIKPEGVLQIMLAGMGILQTLPLCATLAVEKGFIEMVTEITYMILSGGPLYFIFHIQTKCFYFQQTLLAGGAMYRPTGRGFVTRHSSFDENFRFFASSHIYLGVEIMMSLIFYGIFTVSKQYFGLTWSLWLVVISFTLGPFWFNPLSFESPKVLEDYAAWTQWMDEAGGRSEQSWSTWWKEENAYIRELSFSWKICLIATKCTMWSVIGIGLLGSHFFHTSREQLRLGKILGICFAYLILKYLFRKFEFSVTYASRRLLHYLLSIVTIVPLIYLFVSHTQYFRYTIALYYLISAINYIILLCGFNSVSIHLCKVHDTLVGHFIFGVLLLMSLLQIGTLQTWLLYHNALSAGVVIEDILKYARKTKERANDEGDISITELKTQLAHQERLIQQLIQSKENAGAEESKANRTKNLETTPLVTPKNQSASIENIPSAMASNTSSKKNYGSVGFVDQSDQDLVGKNSSRTQLNSDEISKISPRGNLVPPHESAASHRKPSVKDSSGFFFSQPTALPPR